MKALNLILNSIEYLNISATIFALIASLFLLSTLDIRIAISISLSALFLAALATSKHLWATHQTNLFFAWMCFFCGLGLVFFIHLLPLLLGVISSWF